MPVPKLNSLNSTDLVKLDGANDSVDYVSKVIGREPFISFTRASDVPVQWYQIFNALDQPDLSGWPLIAPLKVQMQKCDKCSREFCSSINYRRHVRVHHRLKKLDKDSAKNRELLKAFWDKLSEDDKKEVLSFKDVNLEEVPGSSIVKSMTALVRKPGLAALPHHYLRAGSILLDIIQGRQSRFPLTSDELFSILDDASEGTVLCGAAASMQRYIFDGEIVKIGLETRNLIACTSFLVEQKLVKEWLADKDAEALRCQKLLVEEEEAAQRRQAHLLEKRRQKKLRQKEQKGKEQRTDEVANVGKTEETFEQVLPAEQSHPLIESDSDSHDLEAISSDICSSIQPIRCDKTTEDGVLDVEAGFGGVFIEPGNGHDVEQNALHGNNLTHTGVPLQQLHPKLKWNHHSNGFHTSRNLHGPKPGTQQKHGGHRDGKPAPSVNENRKWSRKQKLEHDGVCTAIGEQKEATHLVDNSEKCEVLIGSIPVTLASHSHHEGSMDGVEHDSSFENEVAENVNVSEKPGTAGYTASSKTVKLWRPTSRNGIKAIIVEENADTEYQGNGVASDNSLRSSIMDEELHPGSLKFSSRAAKAFLAERWKKAISGEHLTLVLSPNFEENFQVVVNRQPGDNTLVVLHNAQNQLVNQDAHGPSAAGVAGRAKSRAKPDKGVMLKYIPKQRNT